MFPVNSPASPPADGLEPAGCVFLSLLFVAGRALPLRPSSCTHGGSHPAVGNCGLTLGQQLSRAQDAARWRAQLEVECLGHPVLPGSSFSGSAHWLWTEADAVHVPRSRVCGFGSPHLLLASGLSVILTFWSVWLVLAGISLGVCCISLMASVLNPLFCARCPLWKCILKPLDNFLTYWVISYD